MRKRRAIELFSISFLDLLSGALGAVIILYVAIPKNQAKGLENKKEVHDLIKEELSNSQEKIKKLEEQLSQMKRREEQRSENSAPEQNLDVGFKFKGKNIVFIIDTSQSMVEEDRMGQVKAGLKMLITALPSQYKIDIVQYPVGERAPFRSLWGDIKETIQTNKNDVFDFVYSMHPFGGTPTREALLFVIKNYETTTDIVLLTDGVPTLHNSNTKDDIEDILRVVQEENTKKIQINTIGVGSAFIRDKTSDGFKFLKLLSEQNGGFFVGF